MTNKINRERLVEGALAILSLTRHDNNRVWKGFQWELLDEMFERGWITEPVGKAKSVVLTQKGSELAEIFLEKYFGEQKALPGIKSTSRAKPVIQQTHSINPARTHVIRCTGKLLKELRIQPVDKVPPEIDKVKEWHANLIHIQRRKCLLITHSMSLYSLVILGVRRKELDNFAEVFNRNLAKNLAADQVNYPSFFDFGHSEIDLIYTKTNNRSILGSMNDLVYSIDYKVWDWGGPNEANSVKVGQYLNEIPMGAIGHAFPLRELRFVLSERDNAVSL